MFERTRRAFRAFAAAEVREPTAAEISAATPIEDWDDLPPDSANPLRWRESWQTAVLSNPPLLRCVSKVASDCARLVASTVTVLDGKGRISLARRDRENAARLRESVDGGVSPALDFWRDAFTDLLTDGNALVAPVRNGDGLVVRLRLMRAKDARYDARDDSFRGRFRGGGEVVERVPRVEMAHARMFGAAVADGGAGRQWPFSDSPIRLLGGTLGLSERIVSWLYRSLIGPKGSLVLSPKQGRLSEGQQKRLVKELGAFMRSNRPMVGGAPLNVSQFGQSAREAAVPDLQDFQLREVARVYGVPLPLIGSPVSAWGSGIEALAREYWKGAVAPRLADVLVPLSQRVCVTGRRLAVDSVELIRGDSGEAARLLQVLRPNNAPAIATDDQCRHIADLPPLTDEERAQLERENAARFGSQAGADAGAAEDGEADGEEDGADTGGGIAGRNGRAGRMSPPTRAELEAELDDLLAAPPTAPPQ